MIEADQKIDHLLRLCKDSGSQIVGFKLLLELGRFDGRGAFKHQLDILEARARSNPEMHYFPVVQLLDFVSDCCLEVALGHKWFLNCLDGFSSTLGIEDPLLPDLLY